MRDLYRVVATQWDSVIQPDLLEVYGLDPESPRFLARRWRATWALIVALSVREGTRLRSAVKRS